MVAPASARQRLDRIAVTLPGLVAVLLAALVALPASAAAAPTLTFADEFNGLALDRTRWSHRATGPRFDAVVTPDAVSVGGGALTIKTYTLAGTHYTGMIGTQRLGPVGFEQTYGWFEARMRFASASGQWSAFWLQSPTLGMPLGDPARAGVEMDVAEHRVRCVTAPAPTAPEVCGPDSDISDRIQQALIWDGYGPESKSLVKLSDPLPGLGNGSWHTWTLRWTPDDLTFYYDGVPTWYTTGPISRRSQYLV